MSEIDSVGLYLAGIGEVDLLKPAEERYLAQEIELGHMIQDELFGRAKNIGYLTTKDIREATDFLRETDDSMLPERESRLRAASPYLGILRDTVKNPDIIAGVEAKDRFVRANLRLVVSLAKKYPESSGVSFLDLVQEGNMALAHAVDMFKWRKGFKFSTYATPWIQQSISATIDGRSHLIAIPKERARVLRTTLRKITDDDLLDCENARLRKLTTPYSIDRPLEKDETLTLKDVLTNDPNPVEGAILADHAPIEVKQAVENFFSLREPPHRMTKNRLRIWQNNGIRKAQIVLNRFGFYDDGEKQSLKTVGQRFGITTTTVSTVVNEALRELEGSPELNSLFSEIC